MKRAKCSQPVWPIGTKVAVSFATAPDTEEGREPLTLNLSTATDASERDFTENGVTFKAKVMELKTVTTVKA